MAEISLRGSVPQIGSDEAGPHNLLSGARRASVRIYVLLLLRNGLFLQAYIQTYKITYNKLYIISLGRFLSLTNQKECLVLYSSFCTFKSFLLYQGCNTGFELFIPLMERL